MPSAETRAKRRSEWMQGKSCVCSGCRHHEGVCGSVERLEIDHVDAELKTMNSSRVWSVSLEKRLAELEKCQVLCHDCHVEKTRINGEKMRRSRGSSSFVGVRFDKRLQKWRAQIRVDEFTQVHLGCFSTEIEAALAYDKTARELFGESAYQNFRGEPSPNLPL